MSEFSPDELSQLVTDALNPKDPSTNTLLGLYDDVVFQTLYNDLIDLVGAEKTQLVFENVREARANAQSSVTLSEFSQSLTRCKKCPNQQTKPLVSIGNHKNPLLYFLHDGPISTDSRDYLGAALETAGFRREQVCLGFTARCFDKPHTEARDNCASWWTTEIQLLKPKLILPLGAEAASICCGPIKITQDHGRVFWMSQSWAVMPLLGPYYCMTAHKGEMLENDLRRAFNFLYGTPEFPPED